MAATRPPKKEIEHVDFTGKKINIGDTVAYMARKTRYSHGFHTGQIVGFTKACVKVMEHGKVNHWKQEPDSINSAKCIVINNG